MDFVAAIEDDFDIIITMNMQAEIGDGRAARRCGDEAESLRPMTDSAQTADVHRPIDPPVIAPERDLFTKYDPLIAERQALLDTGVRDPFAIVMDEVKSPTVAVHQGARRRSCSAPINYMGMTFDPDVIQAGKRRARPIWIGHQRQPRVQRHLPRPCADVEAALREFYGTTGAIVFSTGYQANLGMISALAGKGEYIILDADSHASIYDGCAMGNAEIVRFRHNSVEDLDKRLGRLPPEPGKLVVLEGVYSMMGDIAPLKEMVAVSKKHGAMVLVDEAHSMGFFGPEWPRRL